MSVPPEPAASATPSVVLNSVTGVDVELRIAGPGSRSYAFVIDWHIRVVLALAWFFGGLLLYTGALRFENWPRGSVWSLAVVMPASAIYFLYHPLLEILMRGSTPGKRIAGVRLVSRGGDIPGVGALLVRNVFRIVDSMPFAYVVGLVCVAFTRQHVRIGDLAAGTLLVHDRTVNDTSFGGLGAAALPGGVSPQLADLVHEVLDRWDALEDAVRCNLARSLIARLDPAAAQAASTELSFQLRVRLKTLLSQGPAP